MMNFNELLSMSKAIYENTASPIALTDEKLNVCWANADTLKRFPSFSLQNGLLELIDIYDYPHIMGLLEAGRTFYIKKLAEPFNEVTTHIVPVLSDGKMLGCQVFFRYNGSVAGKLPESRPEDVVAAFSHEYRMPLTVIFSTLGLMARHLADSGDDVSKTYVNLITQNSYRILRLSNNITEVSRYRSGISKINLKKGDLCEYVFNLCEAAKILTKSVGIPLDCIVPEKKIITEFDPEKLSLAIYNLISNSCKYTREGNRICVRLEEHGGKATISVADKGEGIKSEIIGQIFEPYFSQETESAASGAGLGLALVKFIITQHGGTIALQSNFGSGTTVAFTLPIKNGEEQPDYIAQNSADFLADRFSLLYVQMSDVCGSPLP